MKQAPPPARRHDSLDIEPYKVRRAEALENLMADLKGGASGFALTTTLSDVLDGLLLDLDDEMGSRPPSALYATGSYGRRRPCPASDLDLLVVYADDEKDVDALGLYCGGLQTALRDIGFKVGMAARTFEECAQLAREDKTIAASMMDARLLWMSDGFALPWPAADLGVQVAHVLRDADGGRSFAGQLREGMRRRHQKAGQTVYLLEPDVKSGHGGLRDLDALQWSATALFGVHSLGELAKIIADPQEVERVEAAVDFLLRVRVGLHLLGGRFANNRLTFERQERLASFFEDVDTGARRPAGGRGLLPVEVFMQRLYQCSATIAFWSRRWQDLWLLEESETLPIALEPGLCVRDGHVDLTRAGDEFAERGVLPQQVQPEEGAARAPDPLQHEEIQGPARLAQLSSGLVRHNPLRIFEAALDMGLGVHPMVEVQLTRSRWRPSDVGEPTGEMALSLKRILTALSGSDALIDTIAALNLIVAVMPEFKPIEALAQHDVYHVLTVDAHLRRALVLGKALLRGEGEEGEEIFKEIAASVPSYRHEVLLLSCLLHDVGKGRGGDHSVIGGRLVRTIGRRLQLTGAQIDHLAFLVEQHLLLPRVSQRRDLTDEETIRHVALIVRTRQALDDLTLLAVADMKAVGPRNFTKWKAHLLAELYHRVRFALENGVDALWRTAMARGELRARVEAVFRAEDRELGHDHDQERTRRLALFFENMPLRYLTNTEFYSIVDHVRVFLSDSGSQNNILFFNRAQHDYSELVVSTRDRPGTLATIAGVLSGAGINILSAHIHSDASGWALDIFTVRTSSGGKLSGGARFDALREQLLSALTGELDPATLVEARRIRSSGLPPRPSPTIATVVAIDQTTSRRSTIVEVKTRDRVGLLYTIARYLFDGGYDVQFSKLDTEGERAIDVFYVERLDEGGKLTHPEAHTLRKGLLEALDAAM